MDEYPPVRLYARFRNLLERVGLPAKKTGSKTRKTLFLTMVTSFGVSNVSLYPDLVQKTLTMDELF